MKAIDINCDLGEGGEFDDELMPLISSCNIACGGHFGDDVSVGVAVKSAKHHKVNIGAHPSYPDVMNFGRQSLKISKTELKKELHKQIDLVQKACNAYDAQLHHIKPHGALYNDMLRYRHIADLVLEVVSERNKTLILFCPPHVQFSRPLPKHINLWYEGFADRAYTNDLSLVSRTQEHSVIYNSEIIFKRVLGMVLDQEIISFSGETLECNFDTICVHSDTPNAKQILQDLNSELSALDIKIGYRNGA